jgi:hypothetical protein
MKNYYRKGCPSPSLKENALMDYEKLKADVKEIADIASAVPEKFRDKCFELLLTHLLRDGESPHKKEPPALDRQDPKTPPPDESKAQIPITTALRLLMKKTEVTTEQLEKILFFDGGQVHFIREPHDTGITTGQMEWALLLALKNAIENNELSSDPEKVRSVCQEKGFYDRNNFGGVMKAQRNAKLFKNALVSQGPSEPLSNLGQDALGELIKKLAGEG